MPKLGPFRTIARLLCLLVCLLWAQDGRAASPKDIKIGLHVIEFVINPPAGRSTIGVVYDGRNKDSADDAQAILEQLSSPLIRIPAGLKPTLIDIRDLDDAALPRALIVADHMRAFYDKLSAFGRRNGTLIMSTDLDCARQGKCTVGVASVPRVEVIVSSQQAQASAIQFSEAFRMMVSEY